MRYLQRLAFVIVCMWAQLGVASTEENARALFEFAEASFPELLRPAEPDTLQLFGFFVRHYTETDIYLGVQGDKVWAFGAALGPDVIYIGRLSDLITIEETDISDSVLTNRNAECSYYAEDTFSSVRDIKRNILFTGSVSITVDGDECVLSANSIPNHDFNDDTAAFATDVAEVDAEFRIPLSPAFADQATPISLTTDNGVLLNGVKIDLLAAACYGVADEKIGCNDMSQPWRFDPMSPLTRFGTDAHNAHTQPDGSYHYHGNPKALFDAEPVAESPLVGFAADGFPIFGSYIEDNGQIRAARSSYQLKAGSRPSGEDDPGGDYDGTYVDDYEYVAGLGDLDECNGMMRNGVYGYYIIDEYPWVLACYKGTPNASFNKGGGGAGDMPPSDGSGMMPPDGGDMPPGDGSGTMPPDGSDMPPGDGSSTMPPDGGDMPPGDGSGMMPPEGCEMPPSDGSSMMPPDGGDMPPSDGSGMMPADGCDMPPSDGSGMMPPPPPGT